MDVLENKGVSLMMGKWCVSRDYRECFFYLRKRGVRSLLKIQPDVILLLFLYNTFPACIIAEEQLLKMK